jgi:virginiamycin B lyase
LRISGGASVVSKFEPDTQKLTMVDGANGQFVALGGDGNIWTGMNVFRRVNTKTMKKDREWEWTKAPDVPNNGRVACYQISADSKGNPWCTGYFGDVIINVDKDSGKARFWPTPTPSSMPRRNTMDAEDRLWFAEYTGDKIGMFDTKTEQFKEWPLPNKYTTPYVASAPDKKGQVYAASNMTERVSRLDTNTGEVIEYLIPTDFDSKKITLDPTTDRPVVWMANTRNARIIRVEPLD